MTDYFVHFLYTNRGKNFHVVPCEYFRVYEMLISVVKFPTCLPFAPSSALRKRLHMQGAPLNYAALLRALKLRLNLRQHQNPAHFGGFIFFRNPYRVICLGFVICYLLFGAYSA